MIGGTIVARNYLAHAAVLTESFLRNHPGSTFFVLVVDGSDADRARVPGAQVLLPTDMELEPGEWQRMAGIYTVMEFATSMKPALLRYLLDQSDPDDGTALYLDPDVVVYRPFPEVAQAARASGVALTPHVLQPLPRDGREPTEGDLMHAGIFNLGFICVSRQAGSFLDWWHQRLRHDAVVDVANALFTDQRWIDWVPSLFGAAILHDPGLNVAYWNLHERPLTVDADGNAQASGMPLKFFHFSGFEPERPWWLSKHVPDRPRVRLVADPVASGLCDSYADLLRGAGWEEFHDLPYGLAALPNGTVLTPIVRAVYRDALRRAQLEGLPTPPEAFGPDGGDAFARWIGGHAVGPSRFGLSVWHAHLWSSRADLQWAFPDLDGADAPRFRRWLDDDPDGVVRRSQVAMNLPAARRSSDVTGIGATDSRQPYGWNVVGYHSAELGVGAASRLVSLAVEAGGVPSAVVSVGAPRSRNQHPGRLGLSDHLVYENSVYCVNADELHRTMVRLDDQGQHAAGNGRRIGLWFWEVDVLPPRLAANADLLDEVWTCSDYSAAVLTAAIGRPVSVVPLPVVGPSIPTPYTRSNLGLPEGHLFLFSYDFNSVVARKNPLGLIDAYTRAFGPDDGASLVLKSINGANYPGQLDQVRFAARGRPDIVCIDGYRSADQVQGMVELADCFVSLHRAEGFGLSLAAAMAAGRPVVATGYSGNTTFMDGDTAFLVPYELVPIGPDCHPYPPDASWADPDLDAAAELMRLVFAGGPTVAEVAARGRSRVLERYSVAACGRFFRNRLLADWRGGEDLSPRTAGAVV